MGIGMGLGLATFPFSTANGYWDWVRLCDDAGVDSLWQTDRLVSRTPYLECMSTMAALAGATKQVKFGMNVAMLGIRDPLILAKECATIDYLSNGRLLPAFGLGSPKSRDWSAPNRATAGRGARFNEALEIVTRLWAGESVDFAGEHFAYEQVAISPLPVQSPLPLWIGGSSKAAIERTGRFGTGWQASAESPEEVGRVIADIHAAAARHGRRIDADHMGIGFEVRFGNWDEPVVQATAKDYEARMQRPASERLVVGGAEEILGRIEAYVANGISKFILRPVGDGDADVLAQTERLIRDVQPGVDAINEAQKTN